MYLRAACLFFALALAFALPPVEDVHNALHVKQFYPGHPSNPTNSLRVRCSVNVDKTHFDGLTKLKMFYSNEAMLETFKPMGALTEDKVKYGPGPRNDRIIWGKYKLVSDEWSKLDATFIDPMDGYCQYYMCQATGRHPIKGSILAIYKIFWVGAPYGQMC